MTQPAYLGALTLHSSASSYAHSFFSRLKRDVDGRDTRIDVAPHTFHPAKHFEDVYMTRTRQRRTHGRPHLGMEGAVEDLREYRGQVRVFGVDVAGQHVVVFENESREVVTGFYELDGS